MPSWMMLCEVRSPLQRSARIEVLQLRSVAFKDDALQVVL